MHLTGLEPLCFLPVHWPASDFNRYLSSRALFLRRASCIFSCCSGVILRFDFFPPFTRLSSLKTVPHFGHFMGSPKVKSRPMIWAAKG